MPGRGIIAAPGHASFVMSNAETIERLRHIGWRGELLPAEACVVARVVAQHRAGYEMHDGAGRCSTRSPRARFLKRGIDPAERPAVGDFVLVAAGTPPQIERVLPRRTLLSRAAAGERHQRQIIAANIDTVFVHERPRRRSQRGAHRALSRARRGQRRDAGRRADQGRTRRDADAAIATLRARVPVPRRDPRDQREIAGEHRAADEVSRTGRHARCWSARRASASRR